MPHINDSIDLVVEVFVVHHDKVLLRKHDKYKLWLSVGGHVELDEDPTEAAIREVKEEVGLDVELVGQPLVVKNEGQGGYKELVTPRFMYRHSISETHDHVALVFFAKAEHMVTVNEGVERSEEMRWFTAVELTDPQYDIADSVIQHALAALQEVR